MLEFFFFFFFFKQKTAYEIEEISYYGFTVENCKRPKTQQQAFQKACVDAVEMLKGEAAGLRVVGNTQSDCFPKALLPYTERTYLGHGSGTRVNFLVNYGWEWDLFDGTKDKRAWHSRDVSRIDLVIRWGGMRRLSGFLPVQSVYADFYVEEKLWPDYEKSDFYRAMDWYKKQDVTYGG